MQRMYVRFFCLISTFFLYITQNFLVENVKGRSNFALRFLKVTNGSRNTAATGRSGGETKGT